MEIIFIILAFAVAVFLNAVNFYLLYGGGMKLREAVRLTTVAAALNKLFFTGSGYVAASLVSRNKNLEFHRTIAAFLVLEAASILPWLALGVCFGAAIAFRRPVIFIAVAALFFAAAWKKRDKLAKAFKDILESFAATCKRLFFIVPFVPANMLLLALYYLFIFRLFDFTPGLLEVVKITAVTFTIGYLSPAPAGLGFKEAGMVLLLTRYGLPPGTATAIALADRFIMTVLVGICGGIFGFDLLREELRKKLKKERN